MYKNYIKYIYLYFEFTAKLNSDVNYAYILLDFFFPKVYFVSISREESPEPHL